ncbi:MAG: 50S ribosomal protein L21 [Clostridiaceae bacterium]|jgi:large subunit ribosomal protein L21|nr:50S ribosomal protein L21 [Clostridiaceae bacterium]
MYAIVETGGKQVKVEKDLIVNVEKLAVGIGEIVELPVLLVSDNAGNIKTGEAVSGAVVKAEVVRQDKEGKVIVYKYKAKKNERRRQGHRQPFTALKVLEIIG